MISLQTYDIDNLRGTTLVKCSVCGEMCDIPDELIGDAIPSEITDFVCDACDADEPEDGLFDPYYPNEQR